MSRNFELLCQLQRERELFYQDSAPSSVSNQELEGSQLSGLEKRLFERASSQAERLAVPDSRGLTSPIQSETCALVQRIFLGAGGTALRAVVFSVVDRKAQNHWIAARVADLLATYTQDSICIVDADVSKPSLHNYFGIANEGGLAEALLDSGPIKDFTIHVGKGSLQVMPAGVFAHGNDLSSILASGRLRSRVSELMSFCNFLIVNAPPAESSLITPYLAALTDGVILVVEPHFTPRHGAYGVRETVRAAGGRVLGVVLQQRELKFPSWKQAFSLSA